MRADRVATGAFQTIGDSHFIFGRWTTMPEPKKCGSGTSSIKGVPCTTWGRGVDVGDGMHRGGDALAQLP